MALSITSLTSLASAFDDILISVDNEPETFYEFEIDPLVLSCAKYRISKTENGASFISLKDGGAYFKTRVIPEDHVEAKNIRDYYRGKIMFAKLRGSQMSKFRQDLSRLVADDWESGNKISEVFFGMIHKLPYFYQHDLTLASEIFDTDYQEINKRRESWSEVTLTYIRSLDEYQKRSPSIKYWFKDEHDTRFCISIEKVNPLLPAWERMLNEPVTVKGNYIERAYDTLHFYQVKPNWKIVG